MDTGGFAPAQVGLGGFLLILGISLLASFYIALLYRKFYLSRATGSQAYRSFPLLGLSTTAIFICIQFSLPLSLGLLGALSIVRFRTPIKEPEEIGFIMLVIASSICCATFNILFLGAILTIALIGLTISQWVHRRGKDQMEGGLMTITLPLDEYQETSSTLIKLLGHRIPHGKLESIQEDAGSATVSYSFPPQGSEILLELQREVRDLAHSSRSSLFLKQAGAL